MENESLTSAVQSPPRSRRPSNWWLIIVAALFIIVPFLTWYLTWFGRPLSDEKIAAYLADESKPRNIQHALTQIEARMEKGDASAKKFYPRIVELSKSKSGEVRKTVAWVLGQDNSSDDFHRALLELLKDSEVLVRRNAGLQLVRFGDASGRAELRAMLQPFEAKSPVAGTIVSILRPGSEMRAGSLLARIRDTSGNAYEFRAPIDGTISAPMVVKEGDQIAVNQTIAWLRPDRRTISDALHALAYVGTKEDLPFIQQCAQADGSGETAQLAAATAKAIEGRVKAEQ